MINNFKLIEPMFYFGKSDNMFFHCQIVRRAKDHKPNKVKEGAIKTYFIRSKEHLNELMDEIILLCEHYGARAYINVSGKDFDSLQNLMLMKLARNVTENIVQNPRRILNSAAGELKSKLPRWIVDIDDMSIKTKVENYVIDLSTENISILDPNYVYKVLHDSFIHAEIPTHQGVHLITDPFNLKKFSEKFPNVDVHKNSMGTLLYYPDSL